MEGCESRICELFGEVLQDPPGVLHVTAVWRSATGGLLTLRIGPDSPRSRTDAFALSLARARCDAIVTTGRILREEPELRHSLPADLAAWRRECRGLPKPPVSIVLTARADLDPAHALLCDANRVIVVTSRDVAPVLSERLGSERLEVVGRDAPSLRDTLSFLQRDRGLPSVCIEAGPSSSRDLYETPLRVDELMLSIYIGASVGHGVAGGVFVDPPSLARDFARVHACERQEESGPWLFERFVRAR